LRLAGDFDTLASNAAIVHGRQQKGEKITMPKFLVKGSYTAEGMKGLKKDKASGREKALGAAAKALGGKLDGLWYSLGDHDVIAVVDLPSHVHIAALCSNVGASGLVSTSTMALLTVAEMDQALGEKVTYRAPGT
jgi:uncharacterized protein with GYD domain